MGLVYYSEEEEEDQFFDSREEISSSVSDSIPNSPDDGFIFWVRQPLSVRDRREKFMKSMGFDDPSFNPNGGDSDGVIPVDIRRMSSDDGAVLGCSGSEESECSMAGWCSIESRVSSGGEASDENMMKNLDDGSAYVADVFLEDCGLREVGSRKLVTLDEFDRNFGSSLFVQQHMQREDSSSSGSDSDGIPLRRKRMKWLKTLGVMACAIGGQGEKIKQKKKSCDYDCCANDRLKKVRVRRSQKQCKEFSAVYMGQDIKGHDGGILTMKFSPDGEYLATGGEDGVVRVWRVSECRRTDEDCVVEDDPSCVYCKVGDDSELAVLNTRKEEKRGKFQSMKRNYESACVVFPPNMFRISEKPLHEFHGHVGDVLDLSWSNDRLLLSSSVDRTVRMWRIGRESCLEVFTHNDYVTSVQFNPVDENYFMSGSIDGKIRIWDISRCRVVAWTDTKEIITAVSYHPDGLGGVVGTMTGDCRFYDASDNNLKLDAVVSLQGKKKSLEKRITSFQFCPGEPHKLLVASADSRVRILDGFDVVCKYKGLRNSGSQLSASFTSDGRHIISASEDSHVYVWTHNKDNKAPRQSKSCEHFLSSNVSVAIPWRGIESQNHPDTAATTSSRRTEWSEPQAMETGADTDTLFLSPSGSFALSQGLFSEFVPKGSAATWPEEKLPSTALAAAASTCNKSQFKFMKTSFCNTSHAWGQVIVTAGWDGRIRSFQNYGLPIVR